MPRNYLCFHTDTPPSLDGTLLSPAWDRAPWTDDFVDIEGDTQPAPPLQTRAKMLWDNEYFYIGAQLEEPQVWATLTQRDSVIFHDNDFEVFLDPDGDNHRYFELEINALGTVWDLRLPKPYRDGGQADSVWSIAGLRTAVHIDGELNNPRVQSRGWSIEIAVPWRALTEDAGCACPPREGDQWRINFSRVEWDLHIENDAFVKTPNRPEHNWVWSPQGVVDMHWPERWGTVQFAGAASDGATFTPDASHGAREFLMNIYHAQRVWRERTGRYAATLTELGLSAPQSLDTPQIWGRNDDFEVSVSYQTPTGTVRRLHVRSDSRLWHSSPVS